MGRISRKYSVNAYNQSLIDCHKKLYLYTVEHETGRIIPVSAYIQIVESIIRDKQIKGAILKHNFRTTIKQGTLLEIQPD